MENKYYVCINCGEQKVIKNEKSKQYVCTNSECRTIYDMDQYTTCDNCDKIIELNDKDGCVCNDCFEKVLIRND